MLHEPRFGRNFKLTRGHRLSMAVLASLALGLALVIALSSTPPLWRFAGEIAVVSLLLILSLYFIGIKNRQLREETLRLFWSEERYRVLAEDSDEVFWEYDIGRDSFAVGESFWRVCGREPARTFAEFLEGIYPENCEAVEAMLRSFIAGEGEGGAVIDVRLRKGTEEPPHYAWCRIRMRPLEDRSGRRTAIIGKLTDISQERLNTERLEWKARTDALTGILNRAGLEEAIRLRLEAPGHRPCALAILDVDLFKEINDFFGHEVGDRTLRELATILRAHFRETDIVGRLGGDEFMVLMEGVDGTVKLRQSLVRLRTRLADLKVPGHSRLITCSIGAALFPASGETFEALYHDADIALYEAKRSGKGSFALYDDQMRLPIENAAGQAEVGAFAFRADTRELVFVNTVMMARFPDLKLGESCYTQMARLGVPCVDCPASTCETLGRDRYACDFYSAYFQDWVRATVLRLRWTDGSDAYLIKYRERRPLARAE